MEEYWIKERNNIFHALEVLDDALEEYDEICGLAFSSIPDELDNIRKFFEKICYPGEK